jgi:hypothetical protein
MLRERFTVMSSDVMMIGTVILLSMIAGWVLIGTVMWAIAEWDERKWRKRMGEIAAEGFDRG